ncbi:YqaJ viral recombinase family protein [Endozoicomonas sp. GU-1]|uniref:YqaJ viral recombinase family protein n=1 Tax=Endozoicomonas sp. GU-1 TaxID=3009078 RepID=UPI0022B4098F|nr:YqaJ viral recombinase family protein [Endozoicomonas sp. GU-1]WBA81572.1 YqaJ viral recombinase family protein [Endozoicomonas sp. GU-1]WBA84525.1 YqaJ viral recombinase family protein [Endozoicomonas sp. GU-1]
MEILDIQQGTPEWLALRQNYFTASEAPAMMGDSPFLSRDQLLHQKKTGSTPEVNEFQQKKFDAGHRAEAEARPLAEKIVGADLFPATGVTIIDGLPLLASFDGLTMVEDLVFEHKLWNEKLVAQIEGEGIEPAYYWQLEQQLLVSGAERVLFVCSDGTSANLHHVYYESQDYRREALIAGWKQFQEDLKNFEPKAPSQVLEGEVIQDTTALVVQLDGSVIDSNLHLLEEQIFKRIDSVKSALVTDQDFADAESAVKFFKETETKLKDGKETALAQVPDIARLFTRIDHLTEAMATKRKSLDKQVKHQKQHIKDSIVLKAVTTLEKERQVINTELTPGWIAAVVTPADFQEVIKGKKNVSSMQSAVNDRLAQARIEQKQQAQDIKNNLAMYRKMAADKDYLFPDLDVLLHKEQSDLMAIIELRLNQEARQKVADKEPEPVTEPENAEDQPDLLYTDGEVTEEILTDDIYAMEKWLGKGSLDCYRFDHHGNEYRIELIIRRAALITPTQQLSLKPEEKETA